MQKNIVFGIIRSARLENVDSMCYMEHEGHGGLDRQEETRQLVAKGENARLRDVLYK